MLPDGMAYGHPPKVAAITTWGAAGVLLYSCNDMSSSRKARRPKGTGISMV